MKTSRIPSQSSRTGLPPAGDWLVQTHRSTISISGRASRIAPTVKATFGQVAGGLHLAAEPSCSTVDVCVDVRSIATGNPVWDDLLRVADPFRSSEHPRAHFVSSQVRWTGSGFEVAGALEIAGSSTSLALTAALTQTGESTVVLQAHGTIDPKAAGVQLSVPGARFLLPREMSLRIDVIASRATAAPRRSRARFALAS